MNDRPPTPDPADDPADDEAASAAPPGPGDASSPGDAPDAPGADEAGGAGSVDGPDEPAIAEHPINPRTVVVLVVAVVVVAVAVIAAVAVGRDDPASPPAPTSTTPATAPITPEPVTTAPAPPDAAPVADLPAAPYEVAQAIGPGEVAVYAGPDDPTPVRTLPATIAVGVEGAHVPLVLLVRSRPRPGWLEVFLPVRPNGSTGLVREQDVTVAPHDYRIEISLSAFRLRAFQGDRTILDAPIAQGSGAHPTPGGLYYTTMLLQPPDPTGPYGTYAYGLSGYSDTLTEFNGGDGQLGIHGTNQPELMGQNVSHGCIRLRNQDIDQLAAVLPLGVPVVVRP